MRHRSFRGALVALLAAGCGRSLCEDLQRDLEVECGVPTNDVGVAQCEALLEGCSRSEERAIGRFLDCFHDLIGGPCGEVDLTEEDTIAMFECTAEITDLTPACLESFTFGGTISTTPTN